MARDAARATIVGTHEPTVRRLCSALGSLPISGGADGRRVAPGPAVVCFEAITDAVLACIDELSQHGFERVLAVARGGVELDPRESWALLEAGAADIVVWDQCPDPIAAVAARVERWLAVEQLLRSERVRNELVGDSRPWLTVLRGIVEVASFTDASVLITGASGTGKELVARLIHELDPRDKKGQLIVLDCTTVVPELSGSEFFGHERGAFTSAVSSRDGAFALAHGGTLFLDEVGELPLRLQAELLRVVQERTYKRVGSNEWRQIDFRLVCATNRDLAHEQLQGGFRADFYHRLAGWTCRLPALHERRDDILPLVEHFLAQLDRARTPPRLDRAVRRFLVERDYPGNVRELRHVVNHLAHRHVGPGPITIGALPEHVREQLRGAPPRLVDELEGAVRDALAVGKGLNEIRKQVADTAYRIVLSEEHDDTARSAQRLKVSQRAVQQFLRDNGPSSPGG